MEDVEEEDGIPAAVKARFERCVAVQKRRRTNTNPIFLLSMDESHHDRFINALKMSLYPRIPLFLAPRAFPVLSPLPPLHPYTDREEEDLARPADDFAAESAALAAEINSAVSNLSSWRTEIANENANFERETRVGNLS